MGLSKIRTIVTALRKSHRAPETPVAVISRGTTVQERVVLGTLKDIVPKVQKEKIEPPALIIVGKTVRFARVPEQTQVQGRSGKIRNNGVDHRILYLGTHPQKYGSLGRIIHWPMIEIAGESFTQRQAAGIVRKLESADLLILTSAYAVKYLFEFLKKYKFPRDKLRGKAFAVVGHHTAESLAESGFNADVVAAVETAQGLWQELKNRYPLKGMNIFFPRSSLPNPFLKDQLRKAGARVEEVTIYRNLKPGRRKLPAGKVDSVLFSSPSTVTNFLHDYGKIPADWQILSKGPLTQSVLKKAGYQSELVAI